MPPGAMCWKQVSKLQKALFIILFYLIAYLVLSYYLSVMLWGPDVKVTFISEEFRIGDKYVLIFLVAPKTPVFTDEEGANVFTSRHCGTCFLTNNIGFLPMSEYDAILVHGNRSLLSQTSAFMDPGKRYLIEARDQCLMRKLKYCIHEPRVTSYSTREMFDLCRLCKSLHKKRKEGKGK